MSHNIQCPSASDTALYEGHSKSALQVRSTILVHAHVLKELRLLIRLLMMQKAAKAVGQAAVAPTVLQEMTMHEMGSPTEHNLIAA